MKDHEREAMGEAIDRFINIPMSTQVPLHKNRAMTLDLYDAARAHVGAPLALRAAEALIGKVNAGDVVLFTTGFIIPPWLSGETDGPIGAAALARTIAVAFDATPIFVIEDIFKPMVVETCQAAGLTPASPENAREVPLRFAVVPFPFELEPARREARRLLDEFKPSALVSIERPGWNEKGVYHPGAGIDISPVVAKLDCLFEEARSRGVLTLGFGDHGGEIGFGAIHDACKRILPLGTRCYCPCESGTAAATPVDVLVVSAPPSNRGANAVQACLAVLLEHPELLHDAALERRMAEACAAAGAIDSTSGLIGSDSDRIPLPVSAAMIDILHEIVRPNLPPDFFKQKHAQYRATRLPWMQEVVNRHAAALRTAGGI